MRVSTLRLWITAGFGLLVTEAALLVYLFIRVNGELASLQKSVRDLKKESDQRSLELRTINDRLGRARKTTTTTDEPETKTGPVTTEPTETAAGPAEWVAKFREAVLREDAEAERAAAGALRGFGSRGVRVAVGAYRSESNLDVRRKLIALVGSVADPEALAFLESEISLVTEKPLRLAILAALLQQADTPSFGSLSNQLAVERDPEVLGPLVEVVRKIHTDEATAALVRKYDTLADSERAAYLTHLVGIKRGSMRPFFERVLKDSPDPAIRILAVRGLAECGDATTIPLLDRVKSGDANEEVKREAEKAIAKLRQ
ncbi:MAG: HEAT repeat domain-containing protein [Planctomycetes bacterium]|nr:HEAT repeat domain-containing protein [Planctomycetota bacterium]